MTGGPPRPDAVPAPPRPPESRPAWAGWTDRPVSAASLAAFRVAFGLVMAWEAWRYLSYGWVRAYYVETAFTFSYWGFGWVRPLPEPYLSAAFVAVGACGVFVALGWAYRWAAGLLALGTAYVFLLEQAHYLNHFYLLVLLAGLLAVLPAARAYSLDAAARRRRGGAAAPTVPAWTVWLLRFQVGAVYAFAAVAKVNPDWLAGEPIGTWVAGDFDGTPLAAVAAWSGFGRAIAWGGLALDLLAVPALLWRPTRVPMTVALVTFHLMNAWMFTIGVFPWLMILALGLFYPPDWPVRLADRVRRRAGRRPTRATSGTAPPGLPRWGAVALAAYVAVQVALPLRHWLYPGDVAWTEEGHRYAWRMKLRDKDATHVEFRVVDAAGASWAVDPRAVLSARQARKMSTRPDMILQFAHRLADWGGAAGVGPVRVYATVEASLNGRPARPLVDPAVDLAAEPRSWRPKRWVLPLDGPLPTAARR